MTTRTPKELPPRCPRCGTSVARCEPETCDEARAKRSADE